MNKYIKTLPINLNNSLSQPVYFFSNKYIDNNIYLCQQCNSIENALFIIDVWNKFKYNIGTIDSYKSESNLENDINLQQVVKKIKKNNSFNLSKQEYFKSDYYYYIYVSDSDIIEKIVGEGDNDYKLIIYKKDNILHYIALLFYKEASSNISISSVSELTDEDKELYEKEKRKKDKQYEKEKEKEKEKEIVQVVQLVFLLEEKRRTSTNRQRLAHLERS